MITAGLVFAAIAALLHVYIFRLESFLWTEDKTMKTFGIDRAQAEQTKQLAYNQGFYNLFLAVVVGAGIAFYWSGDTRVGLALIAAGAGSMVAAGLVLAISDRRKLRAALIQLAPPLAGLVLLALG